jgi:hypothetical protein
MIGLFSELPFGADAVARGFVVFSYMSKVHLVADIPCLEAV